MEDEWLDDSAYVDRDSFELTDSDLDEVPGGSGGWDGDETNIGLPILIAPQDNASAKEGAVL